MGQLDRGAHLHETTTSLLRRGVAERADELVASDAHDRVVGAKVPLDRPDHVAEQRVAGCVALAVVDLLEPVHVDVGQHETSVPVPGAVDLAPERDRSELAAVGAGEVVVLCLIERGPSTLAVARGGSTIRPGLLTIGCRMLAIDGSLISIGGPLISLGLELIPIGGHLIAVGRRMLAIFGGPTPVRRSLRGLRLRMVTVGSRLIAVGRGALAITGGPAPIRGALGGLLLGLAAI